MLSKKDIEKALHVLIKDQSIFVVDIENKKEKIKVSIDSHKGIKLDDCISINKGLREMLPGKIDEYELEVTSPGLNAPFKVFEQYEKYRDQKVAVLLKSGVKLEGRLRHADAEGILLEEKKRIKTEKNKKTTIHEEHRINFEDIEYTKPVISF
jgi:ribosome maturation factor RimP